MANIRPATPTRNAMMDALVARMNLGSGPATLAMYTGTQPANGDAAATGTLVGTLTFSDPAAPAAADGTVTFSAITEDSSTDNAGNPVTWARVRDSDGNSVFDGDVGTSGSLINLNTVTIAAGGPLRVTSFTLTMPATITF